MSNVPLEGRKLSFPAIFAACGVFSHEKNNIYSARLIIGTLGKGTFR